MSHTDENVCKCVSIPAGRWERWCVVACSEQLTYCEHTGRGTWRVRRKASTPSGAMGQRLRKASTHIICAVAVDLAVGDGHCASSDVHPTTLQYENRRWRRACIGASRNYSIQRGDGKGGVWWRVS